MRRAGPLWIVAAVVIATGGCSRTEGTKTPSPEQSGARPGAVGTGGAGANVRSDGEFVQDVAMMNMAEIELSRMALEKATRADVKAFAQQVVDEHGAAGEKLKTAMSEQPIAWPTQLDEKHRKAVEELSTKQGAEFDRGYIDAMIDGHQNLAAKLESRLDVQSVADWKTAAAGRTQTKALPEPKADMRDVQVRPDKSGNDVTMKINQWAADTYPVAQKHLDTAKLLDNAIKRRSTT